MLVALLLLVVAAALLRVHRVEGRPLRQGEIWVPGIALPAGVSDPHAMLTPLATVTATLWDVHPPTWFLAMWSWTKLFGVSLFAIRLPSVLFGTLAVALTFWLATLDIDWKTGLLGAAFLAFNGHQILWSQLARPYTVTCCIGLCASGFLLLAQRPGRRQSMWTWLYGATALGGLYTLYYFWPVFLTHALWVAVAGRRQPQRFYGLLRLQLLLLILASPIVTLAVFQSRQSYLSDDGFAFFTDFVRFAFLFEPDGDVVRPFSRPAEVAFLVGSVLLLALGLTRGTRRGVQSNGTSVPGPSLSTLALTTIVSCICVAAAAIAFRTKSPHKALQLAATIVVPIAVFGLAVGVTRVTSFALRWRREDEHARAPSLVVMLAVLPTVIVAGISLAVPFLASKGMILFAPYLLIVLAAGVWRISELGRGGRVAAVATVVILGAAHVASVRYHASRPFAPQDYQGLAETWEPQLHERDVVFAQRHWLTTPVFYYLDVERYRFVGDNFHSALSPSTPRVWVLLPENTSVPEEMARALQGFDRERVLRARQLRVELYSRSGQ